ncbi:MAG TPA: glycoside hydrolase family 44 protein [Anaeromyxobacteraceae bacterium]|jgi:hypothetical protein|nr:glycoside hydrolase family 44 protein [Anaeromyxobacteraceae bacterium]
MLVLSATAALACRPPSPNGWGGAVRHGLARVRDRVKARLGQSRTARALASRLRPSLASLAAATVAAPDAADAAPPITFRVDGARRSPISRLVYGINFRGDKGYGSNDTSITTLNRYGGNRLTAYNWETNESNCGSDCGPGFSNDLWLAHDLDDPSESGAAVRRQIDSSLRQGKAGTIVTVPIAGWVAADHGGNTAPVSLAASSEAPAAPGPHFRRSLPHNPAGPTARPDLRDDAVYQDDFIRWLESRYARARRDPRTPILIALDNEPDLWGSTHAELRGRTADGGAVLTGFDELVSRTVEYASAIKDVAPDLPILGPVLSGWYGFHALGHRSPPDGYDWYVDYYLERIRAAGAGREKPLVDVLAVHWYPEALNTCHPGEKPCWSERIGNEWQPQTRSVVEARVAAPRSLWDPTYVENSWVARSVPGCLRPGGCPIRLLPRLKESIARYAPGTKLAVTEYWYGRGGDISGAVAQADVLGIFGREGVYAATLWPGGSIYAWKCGDRPNCDSETLAYRCVFAAFKSYLDFDGKGGHFGDLSLEASTTDPARTSVYASADAGHPERTVLVALNKTEAPLDVTVELANVGPVRAALAWHVTGSVGSCTGPAPGERIPIPPGGVASLRLPPLSVSTYSLQAEP